MKLLKIVITLMILLSTSNATQTLKIVYNTGTPPLKFTDELDRANGMLIDIWKLWAKRNSIEVKFIEAKWSETINMVKDGRADIHAGIYYTKQRDEFLDYTSKPLYNNEKYFFYHTKIGTIDKIDDIKPYVVGIDNGYPKIFMKENFPEFAINSHTSANGANRSFFNGDVKVVLASLSTFYYYMKKNNLDEKEYKYSNITYAYTKQYFGAVKQGNKKLLEIIDTGFKNISNSELSMMELKWTKELDFKNLNKKDNDILFNKEQTAYLKNKKNITMCVDPSWLPFEIIEDKKHIGIVADIYKEFENNLGIPIKLVPTATWADSLQLAKNRECDILSAAAATSNRKKYMNFTKPYLKFPEVIVTREKEPFISNFKNIVTKKIGVVKNSAIAELLRKKYPNINIVDTKNVLDGLYKVSHGELYGFVNTTAAVSFAISKNGLTNLKIASKAGIDYYLRIATRNDEPLLLDIFNRIIDKSDKSKIKNIQENWLSVRMDEKVDYTLVYQILGWFIIILIFVLFWNRKLKKEIEERKQAQEELNKFLQVIEQSQVSITITDNKGVIEYVNPFCTKETGYSSKEFIGANPNILKSGYQDDNFYQDLWSTILSGKTWQGEFSNKKKNGEFFWESAIIAPIFDNSGTIRYFASIKEDITEKIKVQKELQLAQKEANKANHAKSDFLAKMSHEIRTPINAVVGMLYLLEKTNLNATQDNYIKKANGAANSLLGVINDILDFSKIEANKLEVKNEEFDIHTLINDTMSVMSIQAQENELELLTYYDKDFPMNVISDPLRVSQILNNLISNAIKFTQSGEILVSTKLVNEKDDIATLMFCVKDSGIGISKENQTKLFQEFTQVDESATRSFHGTGLGLAISKKLSELLGGKIWIEESQENVGTTICFTIKVKTKTQNIDKDFSLPQNMSHLNVLVIDDNQLATQVLTEMLESFEYSVHSVNSGVEAIQMVQKDFYDLVFLDYKMPILDGIQTYEKYSEILKEKTPKTLMVTAYSQELVEKEVEKYGILGYLTKPISPSTLYDTIVNSLTKESVITPTYKKDDDTSDDKDKNLEGLKLLLVEDNKINQEFAVLMLQSVGLKVDIANNGLEAISMIQTKEYSAVLMDIQMPKLDGLEATRRIRKLDDEYFKNIPIIALSANALIGDREKSLDAGMNEHITKPINPTKLFETLKEFIDDIIPIEIIKQDIDSQVLTKLNSEVFNVGEAMHRMNNNEKAYVKVLNQFLISYENVFEYIDELVKDKNQEALENKIHELKGISGNISAIKLFKSLTGINTILNNNKIPPVHMFDCCKKDLKEVLDEIKSLEQKENNISITFDKKSVISLLINIENNLDIDIVQCEESLAKLTPYLKESYDTFLIKISNALNEFDTDTAQGLIEKFLKDLDNE